MILALVAVLLPALASASSAYMPLPGYAVRAETFPPTDKLLGEVEDPLAALTVEDDDLRDAVISPPSAAWLMGGLRSPNPADRLAAVHSAAIAGNVSGIAPLAATMLRLDEKPELRAAAATALGRIGDAVAAPSLGEALNDPSQEVRYAAALALGRVPAAGA
ncbi:MAG: hypothetical protein COV48_04690, partial [Elusimicrobia bacterium CG11_big_fil_rev_8_21_14_0_20_64_6]